MPKFTYAERTVTMTDIPIHRRVYHFKSGTILPIGNVTEVHLTSNDTFIVKTDGHLTYHVYRKKLDYCSVHSPEDRNND